jgi:hypothetical protein
MKKLQQAQKMLNNPRESPRIRAVAGIIASLERDQRTAIQDLAEAVDGADVPEDLPDEEARLHQLCDAIPVLLSGGGPFALWVEHEAPEEFDQETAARYVGIDSETWTEQVELWAAAYRERIDAGAHSDRALANVHTCNRFGMELDRFETEVVGFDAREYLRSFVAGPLEENTAAIKAITETAEGDE